MRAALAAADLADVGPAAGGIAGAGPEAGCMSLAANFADFNKLMQGFQDYLALTDDQAHLTFIKECVSYRPVLGVQPFAQGQGDIALFPAIYEIIHKLNHMLLVCSYYGTQEDLGTLCNPQSFH